MSDQVIAGYQIEGKLGEGGMGVVYTARDTTLDRRVALKIIPSQTISPEGKERFIREARACSAINHPNIVTVYAAGQDEEGRPYLAMEFLEGRTIREVIDEGQVPWELVVEWAVDLLDALGRLHKEGIIHRDLKPENIFVTKDGRVKLMDFGIARVGSAKTLTQVGTSLGTAHYMSPEQAVAEQRVDPRSDIFSFAVVLHEMLAGRLPFPGEHEMAVMYSIVNADPEPLTESGAQIPEGLENVLKKALEKQPEDRYADADEFKAALEALLPSSGGITKTSPKRLIIAVGVVGVLIAAAVIAGPIISSKIAERKRDTAIQFNEMGTEYEAAGNIPEAKIHYRKATVADPSYANPWNNLGFLQYAAGELSEADSLYRLAIEADSTHTKALDNLGLLRWDSEDFTAAEEYFERAIRTDSTYGRAYSNLAALLTERDRIMEAIAIVWLGLEKSPDNPILVRKLGQLQSLLGKEDEARQSWLDAIREAGRFGANGDLARTIDSSISELGDIQVELHTFLARSYQATGERDSAITHWTHVADSGVEPYAREADQALADLQ